MLRESEAGADDGPGQKPSRCAACMHMGHWSLGHEDPTGKQLVSFLGDVGSHTVLTLTALQQTDMRWCRAVGVMKAAVGLSASVFAVIYAAFQLTMEQFLLSCMVVPAAACMALLPFINHVPRMQKDELMPHGILSKPARFFMVYQVRLCRALPWQQPPACMCAAAPALESSVLFAQARSRVVSTLRLHKHLCEPELHLYTAWRVQELSLIHI